jgi:hypothetical protein
MYDTRWTKPRGFLEDENTGDPTRVMTVLLRTITTERDALGEIKEKDRIVPLWITIDGAHMIDEVTHLDAL